MEIGFCISMKADYAEQIECMKKVGVNRTFIMSEGQYFDEIMTAFAENGIICENLHSPFDGINDMWSESEDGDKMLQRLMESVDKCAKYSVPAMVVHVSSGRPMTPITAAGDKRYKKLMDYAREKGVKIAYENLRYLENLKHNLELYPDSVFCWDCGHENCYTPGTRFMPMFGKRLGALHIHDNACGVDTDDHVLPFDGKIDFDRVAKDLAESGYEGTLMLEIGKSAIYEGEEIYKDMSYEEFYSKAVKAERKIVDMVESYRKNK